MRVHCSLAALLAALLIPLGAAAQSAFEGLDLSSLSSEQPAAEESASSGDFGGFGLDLNSDDAGSNGASSAQADAPSPAAGASAPMFTQDEDKPKTPPPAEMQALEGRLKEIELTADDRVKSVQPRSFIKQGRFELMPEIFVTINDAYFPKYGPGLRLAYHIHESLGIALRGSQYNVIPNDNIRLAKRQLRSQLPDVQPKWAVALDFLWSPFYGKSKLGNAIRHFDIYVVGGLGTVISESFDDNSLLLSTHLGLGSRFSLNDFLALDLSMIETVYTDTPANNGGKGVVQHLLSINLGLSIFIPFSFEYKE